MYRYYSTQRPVDLGTFPKPEGNKPTSIHNYDERQPVEDGSFRAWGYVEYAKPLTKEQMDDYELRDPKAVPEKTQERKPKAEKKSVMADLRKKQAQVAGKEAQKQPMKSKSKEMD